MKRIGSPALCESTPKAGLFPGESEATLIGKNPATKKIFQRGPLTFVLIICNVGNIHWKPIVK
jgi:hypothetical protein